MRRDASQLFVATSFFLSSPHFKPDWGLKVGAAVQTTYYAAHALLPQREPTLIPMPMSGKTLAWCGIDGVNKSRLIRRTGLPKTRFTYRYCESQ